jgi:hypothetical protein
MSGERKAQVTIFFALGLVVLLAVAILYLMLSKSKDVQSGQSIDISASPALSNYVTSCLDTIMNDELEMLGKTGGLSLIPAAQKIQHPYGTITTTTDSFEVLYGITQNRREIGDLIPERGGEDRNLLFANVEVYCPGITEFPDPACYQIPVFLDGYFGQTTLLPPCSKIGANGPGTAHLCKYYPNTPLTSIPPQSVPALQDLLTQEIERKMSACVSETRFRESVGQGFASIMPPKVSILLTKANIIVNLTYNITLEGRSGSTVMYFDRRYPLRFLQLTEYAIDLTREETRNVSFNLALKEDYEKLPSFKRGFTVERVLAVPTSVSPSSLFIRADLITIKDEESLVRGKPLSYSFLVEHRPPMLETLQSRGCDPGLGRDPDDGAVTMTSAPGAVLCVIKDDDDFTDSEMQ